MAVSALLAIGTKAMAIARLWLKFIEYKAGLAERGHLHALTGTKIWISFPNYSFVVRTFRLLTAVNQGRHRHSSATLGFFSM